MMDQWTDRLSEYMDGELPPAEREALAAHVLECAECGRTLQELRQVVARAGQVLDREPERDLWSGIAARISAEDVAPATVLSTSFKRRISFSIPQLAAASVVLMLLSAGTMYLLLDGEQATTTAQAPAATQMPHIIAPATMPSTA